jgi:transposase InsO family protein
MRRHGNAAVSWSGRCLLATRVLERGLDADGGDRGRRCQRACAGKWVGRYGREGERGLFDRSSAPRRVANRTAPERVAVIGRITGRAGHRVHAGLQHDSGRYSDGAGRLRGKAGWEFVHIGVDDYSRLAYVEVLADEKATTAIGFLRRALTFFARYGIQVERVLTDNASAYISTLHALARKTLGIRHLRTRPRRRQTNGKAERFIRTLLAGWAYAAIYRSSQQHTAALDGWLWHYNHRRRHSALGHQPPATRTNLLGSHS